ncbi:intradiol ring-cleavage dioxygenase [Christiangramia salexigens]|uniref:Intradiol ring-cleavage dioxygenase n=1 Tax=Christiangramia salexigens TaxID=1913577 RepID=A0A1L3J781_9FLAO|nr:intradiol ring-cleavage dioxygenase [Christiangramia salexigens]APG60978.1 intradiol ring-cleavage dioxygenase [Christiangramia salexigens]
MKTLGVLIGLLIFSCAESQETREYWLAGGPCEGCEAVMEYGDKTLSSVDTLPGFDSATKKLKVSGTIFKGDGETPAGGVILYIYQTNAEGLYAAPDSAKGWARRHGELRGWMKTGNDGKYTFYTLVPGNYPGSEFAAHIHPTVLEPDGKYYYLQDYLFEGDPYMEQGLKDQPRGGTDGILKLKNENGILVGTRDLILGKNIPGYPKK